MTTPRELVEERWRRIKAAVALEKPDRVPVVPLGDAFAARMTGVSVADFCTKPEVAYPTMVDAFTSLGDIDGIQHASYNVNMLSTLWLSRLKIPGRDLPENDLWQVEELELMTPEDYDQIVDQGFGPWRDRYFAERLDNLMDRVGPFVGSLPDAFAAWDAVGIPVVSPVITTIPYEYFCGGRSMRAFVLDLHRMPDKVQAAMDAAQPALEEGARGVIRAFGLKGIWVGGWRAASEFLSPKLWERFVFPYYKRMVDVVVAEGCIPVLHFDSNWTRDLERFRELPKAKCVLSLDGMTDIHRAKELLGDHMCLMGDVPPRMLTIGSPDEVHSYATGLVRDIGPTGFILAQGCDIPPDAKPDNVRAMIAAVH